MKIGKALIQKLHLDACESERKRVNYDLRSAGDEVSLRLLTVLEPETVVPIHRHPEADEFLVVVSGEIEEIFYNEDGTIKSRFPMRVGGEVFSLIIPKGQWHTVKVLEPCSAIIECRRGPYKPIQPEDIKK